MKGHFGIALCLLPILAAGCSHEAKARQQELAKEEKEEALRKERAWAALAWSRPNGDWNYPSWSERNPEARINYSEIFRTGEDEYRIRVITRGVRNLVEEVRINKEYVVNIKTNKVFVLSGPDKDLYLNLISK